MSLVSYMNQGLREVIKLNFSSVYCRGGKVKKIKDFGLISLVQCIYKLISKVLTTCSSKVLREVIGESQHVFVEGQQILDVVIVANEVVDDLVGNRREGMLCKLNMEKSYVLIGSL